MDQTTKSLRPDLRKEGRAALWAVLAIICAIFLFAAVKAGSMTPSVNAPFSFAGASAERECLGPIGIADATKKEVGKFYEAHPTYVVKDTHPIYTGECVTGVRIFYRDNTPKAPPRPETLGGEKGKRSPFYGSLWN